MSQKNAATFGASGKWKKFKYARESEESLMGESRGGGLVGEIREKSLMAETS